MINFSNHSAKEHFLNEELVLKSAWKLVEKNLDVPDPVAWAVARGLVKTKFFYPKLARIFGLAYYPELPVRAGTQGVVAMRVPLELASRLSVFLFEEQGRLYLASSSPFLSEDDIQEFCRFLSGLPEITQVIAPPAEIRRALAQTFYIEAEIGATERMTALYPEHSSREFRGKIFPNIFPIGTSIVYLILLFTLPSITLLITFSAMNLIYFFLNPYKVYIFFRSLNPVHLFLIEQAEVESLADEELPVYTILIPLKNEAVMVPNIVANIFKIEYPPEKLDIKFICEVSDTETVNALRQEGIGEVGPNASVKTMSAELVLVPTGPVSTKPRSCNYALSYARGAFLVIYDAEDRPDPDQLKKTICSFRDTSLDTVCVQARLNFYNVEQNLLTRFFSLEYSFWFDYYLPGSQEVGSAITLGGTSNHFITESLRKIGSWDPHNVTEDADLGLRLYRHHWKTAVVNSYTLEEANSQLWNWLRQRTRWQKGFLLTFLVHASHPRESIRSLGLVNFLKSLFTVGSNFFLPLFNPLLWIMFACSFLPFETLFSITIPIKLIRYVGIFNLTLGNLMHMGVYALIAYKKKQWRLLPLVILMPFYWLLISAATFRALFQFVQDPYRWEKTKHGLK